MILKIQPVVKQTMPQTRANERTKDHIPCQTVEQFDGNALLTEYFFHNKIPQHEGCHEKQTVPAQRETTYAENLRINIPIDNRCHLQQAFLNHVFGYLHCVKRSALSDLISDAPEMNAVGRSDVFADTSDKNGVLVGCE